MSLPRLAGGVRRPHLGLGGRGFSSSPALCRYRRRPFLPLRGAAARRRRPGSCVPPAQLRRRSAELAPAGELGFVAVRFRAGRLSRFCQLGWSALSDRVTSAEELWGRSGGDLGGRLARAVSRSERTELLSEFLRSRLEWAQPSAEPGVARTIDRLYYSPQTRIASLASELGRSRRQLERIFARAYGIEPKRFASFARLHRTLRALALEPEAEMLATVLESGYYDQSHFYRDLRRLSGIAPGRVLERVRSGVHFYLPSRFEPTSGDETVTGIREHRGVPANVDAEECRSSRSSFTARPGRKRDRQFR